MSMAGYTKLFNSILASTIWEAKMPTRIVWITLLAMADKHGVAEGSVPGLATFARVSIEDCRTALAELSSPDPDSRSKEHEGRRIEAVEGGWRLINHDKYRSKLSTDERREYLKIKQREYRAKHTQSTNVNNVSDTDTVLTQAEAEATPSPKAKATTEAKTTKNSGGINGRSRRPIFQGQRFVIFDWMLEDLSRVLGPHTDAFDLHSWFFDLDARAVKDALVKAKDAWWPWVQQELLLEASRRGLPTGVSAFSKQGQENIEAGKRAIARIQGRTV